ncbi:MAG: FMN-binding protein [Erysipelothrix sp.]|nr:FMN-binding protein [Erysipelothrix sp.]
MGFKQLVLALSVMILVLIGLFVWIEMDAQREIEMMHYEDVEMSLVQDGTYEAEVITDLVSAKVQVIVEDHEIIDLIILGHTYGLGYNAETIRYKIIEQNTYEVDTISGVTLSSEAIKSATSLALKKGY